MSTITPTAETYTEFDRAYAYFNKELFAGVLPACVITMQRHKKAYGHFWGNTWTDAKGEAVTDEIAMNPDAFRGRSTAETLSTLVHEMCHLQQHHFGKPSRNGYHNKEWAQMMDAVGLIPSDTAGRRQAHGPEGVPLYRARRAVRSGMSGAAKGWVYRPVGGADQLRG